MSTRGALSRFGSTHGAAQSALQARQASLRLTQFSAFQMPSGLPSQSCGVALRLWQACRREAIMSLYSPFVVALAQGTLPRSAFQHYIAEDAFFLRSFASGYQAAIDRCGPAQQHLRPPLHELLGGVEEELRLHESYAAGWGVDLGVHASPHAATTKYLALLHGVVDDPSAGVASIMASMVPCLRRYAWLGCQLAQAYEFDPGHPYGEWVASYSSPEYQRLPGAAESILDETSQGEPFERLLTTYRAAMAAEVAFFAAQPYAPPARSVDLLVVDFDDTCTAEDSTGIILQTGIKALVAQAGEEEGGALHAELTGRLTGLVDNYVARRGALLEEILPEPEEAVEEDEFDMAWLGDFLDRLSEFDRAMNDEAVSSGLLAGIRRGQLSQAGAAIRMRPGCLEVLRHAVEAGIPTHVVSVNWSAEMVRAALAQQGLPVVLATEGGASSAPPGSVLVHANELEYFGDVSTGNMKRRCECAADKGRLVEELLLDQAASFGTSGEGASVYIGDSMTDVPAFLSTDFALLVGVNPLVRQVAAVAGIQMRPLLAAPLEAGGELGGAEAPVLYEAWGWDEVEAWLFSQFRPPPPQRHSSFREHAPAGGAAGGARPPGRIPRVLCVAGSDSGGGAGIQADLKACMALGAFGTTAVTALTAQNTNGLTGVHVPPSDFLRQQMRAVLGDLGTDVIKTGMLPSPEVVAAVAEELQAAGWAGSLVVDPVLVATSGDPLAGAGVTAALQQHLFPLATIITPNIPEASALLGGRVIADVNGMKHAAEDLHTLGPQWVLVKGGHLGFSMAGLEDDAEGRGQVTDVLFDGKTMLELSSPRISTGNTHGTGCTLAAAIAAELAKGASVAAAVDQARKYVWRVLERSVGLPLGRGTQRPMNHGYRLSDWAADLAAADLAAADGGEAVAEAAGGEKAAPRRIPNPIDLRVYAVTDPGCNTRHGRSNAEAVRLAIDGGATVVQLREKDADGGRFVQEAAEALEVCRAQGVPLLVNDRVDVALAVDADGVHVGQDDLPCALVRRLVGPDRIVGVSVKTAEEAVKAEAEGADYIGAGAVFPTATKESGVIGLPALAEICKAVRIPVVSIGGVATSNAGDTVAAGAAGAAVVTAIFDADSPAGAARALRRVVDDALQARRQRREREQ